MIIMINLRLHVILCEKSVTRLQNKTTLRACEIRSQCISFSHSIVFYIVLKIRLVLPVFLVRPMAKI